MSRPSQDSTRFFHEVRKRRNQTAEESSVPGWTAFLLSSWTVPILYSLPG